MPAHALDVQEVTGAKVFDGSIVKGRISAADLPFCSKTRPADAGRQLASEIRLLRLINPASSTLRLIRNTVCCPGVGSVGALMIARLSSDYLMEKAMKSWLSRPRRCSS